MIERAQTDTKQREQMGRVGCDRLCDLQAIFLVEVFAQYCAQRCLKTLSPRFDKMLEQVIDSPLRSLEMTVLTFTVAKRTWSLSSGDLQCPFPCIAARRKLRGPLGSMGQGFCKTTPTSIVLHTGSAAIHTARTRPQVDFADHERQPAVSNKRVLVGRRDGF